MHFEMKVNLRSSYLKMLKVDIWVAERVWEGLQFCIKILVFDFLN